MKRKPFVVTNNNIGLIDTLPMNTVIHAFKVARLDGAPPIRLRQRVRYKIGRKYHVRNADTNPTHDCGEGLHVATLAWCQQWWKTIRSRRLRKVFVVAFTRASVAAVPYHYSAWPHNMKRYTGKFRVRRFKVLRRVDWHGRAYRKPKKV